MPTPAVERGYIIQFGSRTPLFNGAFPTLVGSKQALEMEQEVATLLKKEAIEVVPPLDREFEFYSRYFIVPNKDGGLRPILDLRSLNRLSLLKDCHETQVQDAYYQASHVSN